MPSNSVNIEKIFSANITIETFVKNTTNSIPLFSGWLNTVNVYPANAKVINWFRIKWSDLLEI
jgi:hypothetical protein